MNALFCATAPKIEPLLTNYRSLQAKVDAHWRAVVKDHGAKMACARGCHGCCCHFGVFAVEAAAIGLAAGKRTWPKSRAPESTDACPLLEDGGCLFYDDRPLICRTQGLPLLVRHTDGHRMDWCPLNFKGMTEVPVSAALDLERLNQTLVAVNRLFIEGYPPARNWPERIMVAEVLELARW